jgi:hypothetical protein
MMQEVVRDIQQLVHEYDGRAYGHNAAAAREMENFYAQLEDVIAKRRAANRSLM